MPIFMDRHDLPEAVTAEAVAKVHQEDLKIQHQFGCRGLTYWFDENRKTAFCLIEAPEKKAVTDMHNKAHGMIPNRIIEVDAQVVNSFLGRIENPSFVDNSHELEKNIINESAYRTIMITKIPDFAFLVAKLEKHEINSFINSHHKMIRKAIARYKGREVKLMRDGFIISFSSFAKAIDCAREIQKKIIQLDKPEFQIKIGLSSGPPVTDSPELFGHTIDLARRLCYLDGNGSIMISSEIREHVLDKLAEESIKALNQKDEIFLNNLMNVVESYWNESGFDMNKFSRKLGLSKAQLYRKLTKLSGFSPNDFIKDFRLRKAAEAIEKDYGNISEIAYQSGFSSPSYFSKCFLKRFGILPSTFATANA